MASVANMSVIAPWKEDRSAVVLDDRLVANRGSDGSSDRGYYYAFDRSLAFNSEGALGFLALRDGSVYRVTIRPPP